MAARKKTAKKKSPKKGATTEIVVRDRRTYELTIIVSPAVKADQRSSVVDSLKKLVEKEKGSVDLVDEIGLRDLAYPIRSERTGWYASLTISLSANAILGIDELVRRDEKILRHLLIRTP